MAKARKGVVRKDRTKRGFAHLERGLRQKFLTQKSEIDYLLKQGNTDKIKKYFAEFRTMQELSIKCVLWGHVFLSEYFSDPTPSFHFQIIEKFFNANNEYNAYPRGFGKTTVIQLCIAFSIVNRADTFIVLLEKSFDEASEVLEAVREEFRFNPDIIKVYGELCKVSARGNKDESIKDAIGDFFINGVRIRGRGFDKNVRGLKSRQYRPSKIILDDVESDDHMENPDQRRKYLMNYTRGVIPAVESDLGSIKMFGTILHDDSLLQTLINNHHGEVHRAWNQHRDLLWPEKWTAEKLEEKRKQMALEGRGDAAFYQEYFNEPVAEEDQVFKQGMFRYFNDKQLNDDILKKPYHAYIMLDPAISKKNTADYTGIVAVVVNQKNEIYVVEVMRERMDPYETVKSLFAMYERWQPVKVGIETVQYQKALVYIIDEKRKEKQSIVRNILVEEIKTDTDKERKINGMQPRYAMGTVYHKSGDPMTKILESELLRFPKGATDDLIDALAGINQLMTPVRKTTGTAYRKFLKDGPRHRQVKY